MAMIASGMASRFSRPRRSPKPSTPTSVPSTTTPMFIIENTTAGWSGNARWAFTYNRMLAKFSVPSSRPAPSAAPVNATRLRQARAPCMHSITVNAATNATCSEAAKGVPAAASRLSSTSTLA